MFWFGEGKGRKEGREVGIRLRIELIPRFCYEFCTFDGIFFASRLFLRDSKRMEGFSRFGRLLDLNIRRRSKHSVPGNCNFRLSKGEATRVFRLVTDYASIYRPVSDEYLPVPCSSGGSRDSRTLSSTNKGLLSGGVTCAEIATVRRCSTLSTKFGSETANNYGIC